MGKFNLSKITQDVGKFIAKRSPEILTGLGIAGMLTTTVLAVKATPKAMILIEKKKEYEQVDKLTAMDTIKTTWKCYVPSAVTATMSTLCLIGASSVNTKRNAALATAYSLSETALKEYREKVVETIGEKKEEKVRDAVAKDMIEKHPVKDSQVIITDKGQTLCYEPISDRYFKSDIESIRRIANDLNRQMFSDMYVSLNDFYYEIGLKGTEIGQQLGWNVNRGLIDLRFSAQLSEDDTPTLVMDYIVPPRYGYQEL